jgi:cyclic pyranopterin phosphate synthase
MADVISDENPGPEGTGDDTNRPLPGGLAAGVADNTDADRRELTHIDENGDVRMVDVSDKAVTKRTATAEGFIAMHPDTLAMIVEGRAAKGDVLACARVAGIMGAKATSTIIPMCHPLPMTKAQVELEPVGPGERDDGRVGIHVTMTTGVTGKTGIEMEALTGCSIACLTIYDMCKAVDRGMEISEIHLLRKEGGRTGLWTREDMPHE